MHVIQSNMTLVLNADSFSDSGLANTEAVIIIILNLHVYCTFISTVRVLENKVSKFNTTACSKVERGHILLSTRRTVSLLHPPQIRNS